jgi:autotransporter translocation and assembly factor TamB
MGRRKKLRWWAWVLIALAMVPAAAIVLVLVVLWVPAASRLAVEQGLSRWDATNPARVEWRAIDGSLAGGLGVDGFALYDGEDRPLVEVERLELDLRLASLVRRTAEVERLVLRGVSVWVDHDWASLADPTAPERPPRPGYGPDLPLRIVAAVEIVDARVLLAERELVTVEALELSAWGVERSASAALGIAGVELPAADLRVDTLGLALTWDDPVARILALELRSSIAEIERLTASYDVSVQRGELSLDLEGRPAALSDHFGVEPLRAADRARIELRAIGGPGGLRLRTDVELGAAGSVMLVGEGVPGGPAARRWATLGLRAELAEAVVIDELGALELGLAVTIEGTEPSSPSGAPGFVAALAGVVDDLRSGEGIAVEADARMTGRDPLAGTARVSIAGAGLELDAELDARERATLRGQAALRVDELGRPLGLVAEVLGIPALAELAGGLAIEARCVAPEELELLRCPVDLRVANFSGFGVAVDRARLDARVELGWGPNASPVAESLDLAARLDLAGLRLPGDAFEFEHLRIEADGGLEHLRVAASGEGELERFALAGAVALGDGRVGVELDALRLHSARAGVDTHIELRRPTRLTLAQQVLEIDALSLAAFGGRVDVDGRLGLAPERSSALELSLAAIDLGQVDPWIQTRLPGLILAGEIDLHAGLEGPLRDPDAWLRARAKGLRIGDLRPGALELDAALGHASSFELTVSPGAIEPARLDLLALDDPALDDAATPLRVALRIDGPLAERLELVAALPLVFGDRPGLQRGHELAARLAVNGFDLQALAELMPVAPAAWRSRAIEMDDPDGDPDARRIVVPGGPPVEADDEAGEDRRPAEEHAEGPTEPTRMRPAGRVDLDLAVAGTPEQPRIAALIHASELALDDAPLGSLVARAGLDERGASLELGLRLGFAQADLRARAPMSLDLAAARFEWARDSEEHLVSLDLRELDLAALAASLGPSLPALDEALAATDLTGLVSLSVRGSGSVVEPRASVAVRGLGLRRAGARLGDLRVHATYVPGEAELELDYVGPLAEQLGARVRAPLELALLDDRPVHVDAGAAINGKLHLAGLSVAALERQLGSLPIAGELDLELEVGGSLAAPVASLRVGVDEFGLAAGALGRLTLAVGLADSRVTLDADVERAGTQILAAAVEVPLILEVGDDLETLEIDWDREGSHRILVTGRDIDDELIAALTGRSLRPPAQAASLDGTELATRFSVDIAGDGRLSSFQLSGSIDGELAVDSELALAIGASLELTQDRQEVGLSVTPSRGRGLDAELRLAAAMPELVAGELTLAEVPMHLRVDAPDFDLRCLAGLVPRSLVDPRGSLHARVRGSGELGAPQLQGRLTVVDAAITVIDLRQRLTGINVGLEFADQRFNLREITIDAGRGSVRGSGRADILPNAGVGAGVDAGLTLAIRDFPLIRPGIPAMTIRSDVEVDLRRRVADTAVTLTLRDSEVLVATAVDSPPQPIPRSDELHFVDLIDDRPPDERLDDPPDDPPDDPAQPDPNSGRFALTVDLRDPLLISGAPIDMAWAGELAVVIEAGDVSVVGELQARRGRIDLFGTRFDLRRGLVTLPDDGSLDPFLDLEAVASTAAAEVTVTVRGRVSRPALEFSSNPALSEYQILTLLITGSTEIGEDDTEVEARAASLLAAVSNPQLQAQLNRSLGIDRAAITFGEDVTQPILTIGKRVTRDVFVETTYRHNAPEEQNTAEVGVEYGFRPRWSLQSYFGDAAVGGVGVYWTRTFPSPRWRSRDRPDETDQTPQRGDVGTGGE